MVEIDSHWFERGKTLAAAQSRYLWLLLILMLFYAALHLHTQASPRKDVTKVPVVDLEISDTLILSSAVGMLSLIVMAIVGSMRALRRSRRQGLGDRTGEEFDLHPNVIDLAFYALPGSHAVFSHLAFAVYAIFLSLALCEGLWLRQHMWDPRLPIIYRVIITTFGCLLWVRATWLVIEVWRLCFQRYATVFRRSN